ncbi:MAG TPA: helix-turn-helix domain-containing protein [Myxococcales bacterium]|nr:helix-turn-helix domain-containing protein [Myxococcales bacterium]
MRQEQLAKMLATSRQTVNQLLRELEAGGALKLVYGGVEILELSRLRRAAGVAG